jgi:cytochrome P450
MVSTTTITFPTATMDARFLVVLGVAYLFYEILSGLRRARTLPPGPTPLPLIGNLHQHPLHEPWVQYSAWHKQFGDMVTMKLGTRTVIVLGSHKAVHEILTRRGKIYCSHPKLVFFGDCMTKSGFPALLPYSVQRRELHRLIVSVFTPVACRAYAEVQERESLRMIREILRSPGNLRHIWGYSVGVSSTLIYGERMSPAQEAEVGDIQEMFEGIQDVLSKENLVLELYPFLNLLPGPVNRWKKAGEKFRQHIIALWTRRIQRGLTNANWNWTRIMNDNKPKVMTPDQFLFLIAELELAASLSTSTLIRMFIATALKNPAATKRVQAEIDAVVGADRLPTFADQDSLPLLRGFITEMMRWKAILPLSMPYTGLEETEYKGYRIPTDACVIANQWALNMDPEVYADPESFSPERWVKDPTLPEPPVFGFGRRVCPGETFGKNSMFIAFARMLWGFDICPPVEGEKGLPPDQAHTALALIANWDTDTVRFISRSEDREKIIEGNFRTLMQEDKALLESAQRSVRLHLRD